MTPKSPCAKGLHHNATVFRVMAFKRWLDHQGFDIISTSIHFWFLTLMGQLGGTGGLAEWSRPLRACLWMILVAPVISSPLFYLLPGFHEVITFLCHMIPTMMLCLAIDLKAIFLAKDGGLSLFKPSSFHIICLKYFVTVTHNMGCVTG